jgi:hypothetical protein
MYLLKINNAHYIYLQMLIPIFSGIINDHLIWLLGFNRKIFIYFLDS